METFTTILGLVMLYSWIHAIIIVSTTDKKKRTDYQNAVVLAGAIFGILAIVGTIM